MVSALLKASGHGQILPGICSALPTEAHAGLARHAQTELEQCVLSLVSDLIRLCDIDTICLSGGVALNCVLAGKLLSLSGVKSLHVASAPGDTGQPVGNAIYGARQIELDLPSDVYSPYLGPHYSRDRIDRCCKVWGTGLEITRGNVAQKVAGAIARGKVVGTFHGRSEFGPRSLGHRSLLADPRDPSMRERLNKDVKRRENYRPYGAAVLEEGTELLFGRHFDSPVHDVGASLAAYMACAHSSGLPCRRDMSRSNRRQIPLALVSRTSCGS